MLAVQVAFGLRVLSTGSAAAIVDPTTLAVERVWTHDPATAAGYAAKAKAIGTDDEKRAEFLDKLIEKIEQEKGGN